MDLVRERMLMSNKKGSDTVNKWRLLKSLTTEEEKERIYINTDNDGNPFAYDDFIIIINAPTNSGTVNTQYRYLLGDGKVGDMSTVYYAGYPIINGGSIQFLKDGYAYFKRITDDLYRAETHASNSNFSFGPFSITKGVDEKFKEILIIVNPTTWKIPVGTKVKIYAR